MKRSKYNLWFLIFLILTLLAFVFTMRPKAQALSLGAMASKTILVTNPPPTNPPEPIGSWNYLDKLYEAENLVASSSLTLKVGKKDIIYYENRIGQSASGNIVVSRKKISDPEREIALVILDTKNGDLNLIKITERGNDLVLPAGYKIENYERSNGITNNAWNTCRQITVPENRVVLLNVWPHYITQRVAKVTKDKRGKTITTYKNVEVVENVTYAPYCEELHLPEFVESGKNYRKSIPGQAFELLRERGVKSKAFPDKLIADVAYLKPEYFERLPLIEHMDYGEFKLDSKISAERVDVILGTNTAQAYNLTVSKAGARGWLQYTRKTWNNMRNNYKSAQLPVFELGASNHVDSMVAAILLHDTNLKAAIDKFGQSILSDPNQLEEMLAASYNGGTFYPHAALRASILQSLEDWLIKPMKIETRQYIEKLRYVRDNYSN